MIDNQNYQEICDTNFNLKLCVFFNSFVIQNHPNEHAYIVAAVSKDRKIHRTTEKRSIKDSIALLVAKENMPIRIVESPYFSDLLQGLCA